MYDPYILYNVMEKIVWAFDDTIFVEVLTINVNAFSVSNNFFFILHFNKFVFTFDFYNICDEYYEEFSSEI